AGPDSPAARPACAEAARHGVVEAGAGGGRRFVHALVQEVVLDALPAGRAARLHAAVAAELAKSRGTSPDELARHLWAARELVGEAAVPALLAAADAAAAVYALEQAETHLRHALTLVTDPTAELSLLLRLFRLIMTGRGWGDEDVRAVVDRAMELGAAGAYNDDTAQLWWSLYFFLLDRNDPSYVDIARTLRAAPAEELNHASLAVVDLTGIFAALAEDDRDRAYEHLRAARGHVEAAPAAELAAFDEHLHVMLLLIEGYWAALHGDREAYRSAAGAAVALADADGRPFPRAVARTLGAACGPYLSDVSFAGDLARRALELDRRFRFGWLESIAAWVRAWAAGDAANLEAGMARIIEAGHLGNESVLSLMLADVHRRDGRPEAAREALLRARRNPGPYRGLIVDLVDKRLAH
ncbi:hypothetical protein AB0M20_28470, partial [Actinoplanes sp. NPDC051633]